MGFGHRVYKSYDPRAKIIKQTADEVFEVTGKNPLLDIALELERIALAGRVLRHAQAVSERRLLLGPHLPGDGLPGDDVPGAVRDSAHRRAGSRSGKRCCSTPSRRSPGRGRSTSAPTRRDYVPLDEARLSRCDGCDGCDGARVRRVRCDAASARARRRAAPVREQLHAPMARTKPAPHQRPQHRRTVASQSHRRRAFDSNRAWEHLRRQVAFGPRPAGIRGHRRDARATSSTQLKAAGIESREQMFIAHDAARRGVDGQRHRDDSRASGPSGSRSPATTTPSCIASSGSSAPTTAPRPRRRCSSSGACSRRGRTSSRSSCCSSTARKRVMPSGAAHDNTYGSRHYVAGGAEGRDARRPQGAGAARHDRRPRPDDPARRQLDAVARRHRLGAAGASSATAATFSNELTTIEDDHMPFLRAGVPVGGHHRPRQPDLAHARRTPRARQRPQPADRRRRRARRASRHREAARSCEVDSRPRTPDPIPDPADPGLGVSSRP